jgi:pre-mRNA-splicing factor 38A
MELKHIGGMYGGNRKPSPFLCLILKMLQIQPEKEIVLEFIRNQDYRFVGGHLSHICMNVIYNLETKLS